MHCGNIKVLLILVAMLISIIVREVAVLVACLALSACVDEIRFQILFKERRQLMNVIKELRLLSKGQTDEIVALQGVIRQQTHEINQQTSKIIDKIIEQTNEIISLQRANRRLRNEVQAQTDEITALQEVNQELGDKVGILQRTIGRQKIINVIAVIVTIVSIVIALWPFVIRLIRNG